MTASSSIFQTSVDSDILSNPLYISAGLGLLFVALCIAYPDRLIGTHARKEIKTATPAFPLIGNTIFALRIYLKQRKSLHEVLRVQEEDGKGGQPVTATFPILGKRAIVINRPEYIHFCQKTEFENFIKGGPFLRAFEDLLGSHGIFVADGAIWKRQRKMASHIFSVGNFKTYVQETIHKDLDLVNSLCADSVKHNVPVNICDVFFRFTLSTFSTMAFSADLNCLPDTVEGLKTRNEFADAFDSAQLVADNRFFDPLPLWLELFNMQGFRMRKNIKILRRYCYRIIDLRLAAQESGEAKGAVDSKQGKDLLQLFMEMGLTREELLPIVLNFLIAGRDTTAQSLAWAFYRFWQHPEVVDKIRQEVKEKLGDRKLGYDDLRSLPYLHAAFYEAIRLNPAVPKNARLAVKDTIIRPYAGEGVPLSRDGKRDLPDIPIKAGESVLWSDWAMARMPEIWGADCKEYKPERFLEPKSDGSGEMQIKQFPQSFFHAFNAGPRVCLGQTLATFEGMAAIAEITKYFDIVYDDNALKKNPPIYADSVTHPIENPYSVRFKARA
ncbi:cytochrome P450 [Meira miltonrushii]|uniref:Cytochrome P450 n=1 Tax=Meira miltonrushii TaxID=1280837 RepID=A0A316VLN5_9BASI|nr:cytochrome P450 [Meira miltonrushii]PWN38466.1 cytochrome P450 [Meira miltonrushii]